MAELECLKNIDNCNIVAQRNLFEIFILVMQNLHGEEEEGGKKEGTDGWSRDSESKSNYDQMRVSRERAYMSYQLGVGVVRVVRVVGECE